jgi:DNA-binding response OmpR family regulator
MRLLLVDDDKKAARVLSRGLQEEGFIIDVGHSGETGGELARRNRYDAIVLDWLLPGKDGLALCQELRAGGVATPILMLTARDSLKDRVAGLNTGADDYITKPFAFEELLARLRALLRRSELTRPPVLRMGPLALDPATQQVACSDTAIELTPKEYAILHLLMRHGGQVVTRARIGEAAWEGDPEDLRNLVDVHLSHLRRKIALVSPVPVIETVRGRGFRIAAS